MLRCTETALTHCIDCRHTKILNLHTACKGNWELCRGILPNRCKPALVCLNCFCLVPQQAPNHDSLQRAEAKQLHKERGALANGQEELDSAPVSPIVVLSVLQMLSGSGYMHALRVQSLTRSRGPRPVGRRS